MNPAMGRPSRPMLSPGPGPYVPAPAPRPVDHIRQLERQRRQELLTPAAISMLLLVSSGFLPAIRPILVPPMLGALVALVILFLAAIGLARGGLVRTGIAFFIFAQLGFYGVALFLPPSGPHGQLSFTHFTAGNLYYFLADVLPIFAASLMTDLPWPILVNLIVLGMNMVCIWVLPHDATFNNFAANLGGPLFLAASITLGQVVLIIFGTAAARTIRNSLIAASRADDLEEINRRIAERQRALEADIYSLQQTQAQIANGEQAHATLTPMSELYPLAASFNLMIERFARLTRAGAELRQIEVGLTEASAVIARMAQGDLSIRPQPTGTIVDGLLASLVQVESQVADWINSIARALADVQTTREQTLEAARDVVQAVAQVRELATRLPADEAADGIELAALAQQNAERVLRLLQTVQSRERTIAAAVARIRTTGVR